MPNLAFGFLFSSSWLIVFTPSLALLNFLLAAIVSGLAAFRSNPPLDIIGGFFALGNAPRLFFAPTLGFFCACWASIYCW